MTTLPEVIVIWVAVGVLSTALVLLMTVELLVALFLWVERATPTGSAILLIHTILAIHWIWLCTRLHEIYRLWRLSLNAYKNTHGAILLSGGNVRRESGVTLAYILGICL